jgi:two-component sensor histidine kinase
MWGVNRNSRSWLTWLAPNSVEAYVFAILLSGVAGLLRWGIEQLGSEVTPFATFYPAVLFAALVGGFWPGLLVVVCGALISWWAFLPDLYPFNNLRTGQELNLLAYFFAALVVAWGADRYRRLAERLEQEIKRRDAEENFRKLTVEELAHRLKNKVATIQSIINSQIRTQPQIRENIMKRLNALSATDDLISSAQGKGARLRDILMTELGPYDVSRISMQGSDVFLVPKLALTMALIFHELATNAAKYGALSTSAGELQIGWTQNNDELKLAWRETGGPTVSTQSHRGFGTRLLSGALDQFGGKLRTSFEEGGIICKMNVKLSDPRCKSIPQPIEEDAGLTTGASVSP